MQGSELVVEPPFVCSLEFVNTSLDVSVEEVFSVAAGFSFADGKAKLLFLVRTSV